MKDINLNIFKTEGRQQKKIRLSEVLAMEVAKGCLRREKKNQQLAKKIENNLHFIKGGEKYIVIIKRNERGNILFREFSLGKYHWDALMRTTREVSESHSIWNATGFIFS